jgi:signal transduction histidine kinase
VCNRADLADIVGELLENAIKYAPGATIRVGAWRQGSTAIVEVADDGPGLSPDELAASAARFWRSPRHRDTRGTGLGLAIVERLAGANGGHLILSAAEPHGLVARVEFPVHEERDNDEERPHA